MPHGANDTDQHTVPERLNIILRGDGRDPGWRPSAWVGTAHRKGLENKSRGELVVAAGAKRV
ncbi:hypothetical protein MFRU_006g00270 [Monilinia fructicola]|nr:hypothetical protein MFRU_006g00270 [Monilinia fructicola]